MGRYINKGNDGFRRAVTGEYVDKSELISAINRTLGTERCMTCVTRCRRFGKSMAAKMLCAYYDRSCDSRELFTGLKIESDPSFDKNLNRYPVISLDITDFTTKYKGDRNIVAHIQEAIISDLLNAFPDVQREEHDDLMDVLVKARDMSDEKFIMIIDEWDAICREFEDAPAVMDGYVNLLRRLFKGGDTERVFLGAYMTGILPIKRYNTESALNNFREYSVVKPGKLAPYFGFLPVEVQSLADANGFAMQELKEWYDGYQIGDEPSVYNPYSVMEAIAQGECESFWATTGAIDSITRYISMNYNGLKDDIIYMLGGGRCKVNTTSFDNDPNEIKSKDDALTILIHLGYLAYDKNKKQCYIPNKEVSEEMEKAVRACNWENLNNALAASEKLLADTLDMNEEAVAKGIELAHDENTSILSYNDENSLACVLSIAYYYAKNDYVIHRELTTGKGFADLVLIPRRNIDSPALVLELKYNKKADAAIDQIHRKDYPAKIAEYTGDILLVGINYDKKGPEGKKHTCRIERFTNK